MSSFEPSTRGRPRRRWRFIVQAAGVLAAVAPTGKVVAQVSFPIGAWREDRVLITNFAMLTSVASGPRHVFAAAADGISVYDPTLRRWELPLPLPEWSSGSERATALAYDPFGGVLWVGSELGSLFSLSPIADRWDRVVTASLSPILEIVPHARESAIYLATDRGWQRLRTASFVPEPVPQSDVPIEVRAVAARRDATSDPFLAAAGATLRTDPSLRRWRLADVEPSDRPGEFWIATLGGGLVRYDTRSMRAEWLPFGLLSRGAGAIAIHGSRIWFGGDGRGPRDGVASADTALQNWWLLEAGYDGAPAGAVRDILAHGQDLWFAADDGLYRLDLDAPRGRDAWSRYGPAEGIPSNSALALAPAPAGVWVGTNRGLTLRPFEGSPPAAAFVPGRYVNGLALTGDTLWAATDDGLWLLPAAGLAGTDSLAGRVETPAGLPVELRGDVQDVAALGHDLFAITEDALFRRSADGWSGPLRGTPLARLGRLSSAVLEPEALWLAGERGAGRMDLVSGQWLFFSSGADLPAGPVRAIAPAGEHVWIATRDGALRLRWRR